MLARQIAIGFGIAVIFPLLVYYGVATFYPPPKYSEIVTATVIGLGTNPTPEHRKKYEERLRQVKEQRAVYDAAAKDFARRVVIVATPLGIAAILTGAYLSLHAIGTGLILGGIFAVAWGYWGYWNYLDDWIRFVSLLIGFAILLFVGYRRIVGPRASPASP